MMGGDDTPLEKDTRGPPRWPTTLHSLITRARNGRLRASGFG